MVLQQQCKTLGIFVSHTRRTWVSYGKFARQKEKQPQKTESFLCNKWKLMRDRLTLIYWIFILQNACGKLMDWHNDGQSSGVNVFPLIYKVGRMWYRVRIGDKRYIHISHYMRWLCAIMWYFFCEIHLTGHFSFEGHLINNIGADNRSCMHKLPITWD